jgi:outer membrane protein assembly factor BamB
MWEQENFGYGTLIAVGNALIILTENGDVVTAELNTESYKEISRKKGVLSDTNWTSPTYANGSIFVRNDQGHLVCLKL